MIEERNHSVASKMLMACEPAPVELPFDLTGRSVFLAGHRGMVGTALVRRLTSERCEVLTADHAALNLTRQVDTEEWLCKHRPYVVLIAAAKVGGIAYNNACPVDFLSDNLAIELN
jgi:GDP-L-fucose synthase